MATSTTSNQPIAAPLVGAPSASPIIWKPRGPKPSSVPPGGYQGIPRLIWEVLYARGLESEQDIQKWLNPSLKILKDPYLLADMDKAVRRLVEARIKQEPVVIYADYDLDGTSGLALLLSAFQSLGFSDVTYYQPKRLSEGYGLHKDALQRLHASGRKLLVSVDLGITAVEAVAYARELGLDVIITDHHLPKDSLPDALAVVNPNRGNCSSGLGHLCGTGVAFYLALALRRALLEEGVVTESFDPKSLLDCFVIGTLTDMVPLVAENRVLVKHGLLQLAKCGRPGLRVLMQALGLWGKPLTSQDVAIRFAPKLNALSRMETGLQPIDLYLVESEKEAQALVERVLANNQDRQASQKNAENEAFDFVTKYPPGSSIFVYSENFHRGVVGLVATRLCQEFGLPAFVGSLCPEEGMIVGSARMPEGRTLNALEAMSFAGEALDQFGGHAVAAGFELRRENADQFRSKIEEFFASRLIQVENRTWFYDAEAGLNELDAAFMGWHEHLSPFGAQFAPPVFCVRGVGVQQVRSLKGGHLRLTLSEGKQVSRLGLWFSPNKDHPLVEVVSAAKPGSVGPIDVLVEPQWNYFNGQRSLQLLIQDIRTSDPVKQN